MKTSMMTLCIVFIVALLCTDCRGADNSALIAKETQKTLTKEAFLRVEPTIKSLIPEQPIHSVGLKWPVLGIREGKKFVGLIAASDGWAGDLSGNVVGADSTLGALFAMKDGSIYGQHIYGYIIQEGIFIPRYAVQVKATIVDSSEYESLKAQRISDIGWTYRPGRQEKVFFKGARIAGVKEVAMPEERYLAMYTRRPPVLKNAIADLYSPERYDKIADTLAKLPLGTDAIDTIVKLDGTVTANHGGTTFTFFIDGFLNYKGEYRFTGVVADAIYSIWPFGYVAEDREIPKMALIFKNGVLEKTIPYSSRAEMEVNLGK